MNRISKIFSYPDKIQNEIGISGKFEIPKKNGVRESDPLFLQLRRFWRQLFCETAIVEGLRRRKFAKYRKSYKCISWIFDHTGMPCSMDETGDDRPEMVEKLYKEASE